MYLESVANRYFGHTFSAITQCEISECETHHEEAITFTENQTRPDYGDGRSRLAECSEKLLLCQGLCAIIIEIALEVGSNSRDVDDLHN